MKLEKVVAYRCYFIDEGLYQPRTYLPNKEIAEQLLDLLLSADYDNNMIVETPSGAKYKMRGCYCTDESYIGQTIIEDESKFSLTIDDAVAKYGTLIK